MYLPIIIFWFKKRFNMYEMDAELILLWFISLLLSAQPLESSYIFKILQPRKGSSIYVTLFSSFRQDPSQTYI